MTELCITIILAIIAIGIAYIPAWIIIYKHIELGNRIPSSMNLSYDDINVIIEGIITEIFTNKYLLYYKLKDVRVIPNMDEEITTITKEVINAFSNDLIHEISKFYSKDFLVMMITRKVQILLVDYTNNNKPNTK